MADNVQVLTAASQVGRATRRPQHRFELRQRPWQIQPAMIAPVLPGETMQSALIQARVVSAPVKNPLIGWWSEFYLFYVKHRDLNERDELTDMHVQNAAIPSLNSAANVKHYHAGLGPNWVRACLDRVTQCYFRPDPERAVEFFIDGLPVANINSESWLDSAQLESMVGPGQDEGADLPGTNPVPPDLVPGYEAAYQQWEHMRALKVTDASFEDYLKSFGVRPATKEVQEEWKPELLRYLRDWTYPTNTVNPADGKPTTALSWAISDRADKTRFFSEPGFIFGVHVVRPKVYLSKQTSNASTMLRDAFSWLPAIMQAEPYTSLKKFAATDGPIPSMSDDYWVDLRDLFMYGDQFINFALTETDAGLVAMPTPDMQKLYATAADADALFVAAANNKIAADGVVNLNVLSRLRDLT